MNSNLIRYVYRLSLLLLCIALVGCALQSGPPPRYLDETKNANYYLRQAKNSSEADKVDWVLLAIQALTKEERLSDASKLLAKLPRKLSAKQSNDKILSIGEIWLKVQKPFDLSYLKITNLDLNQRFRYYSLKLLIDSKAKNSEAQVRDYIFIEKYANAEAKNQIVNRTWLFLNTLTKDAINLIAVDKQDLVLKGWLDLLSIYRRDDLKVDPKKIEKNGMLTRKEQERKDRKDRLSQEIYNWSTYYTYHPAQSIAEQLIGIKQVDSSFNNNGKKVALLLPLSGSSRVFGEAIRQGYVDAMRFYPEEQQQNIMVFDTEANSIRALVMMAKEQGAKSIVGPLLKKEVLEIKKLNPDLPVLALNKVDDEYNVRDNSSNVCFLSLSPEDEAKDAAKHIYRQGKRVPLLLVPKNELGQRVAKSFAMEWGVSSQGNLQAYVQYFDSEHKLRSNMNKNIGIELVGEPINRGYTSTNLSSYTKDAKKFDSIYVYASHDELNLIKPMVEMKSNIQFGSRASPTMFTSSQSHAANASTDFRLDMDGIQFADIPMIMNRNDESSEIPANIRNNNSLLRLYAMGIDAWRLVNRFKQLTSNQLYKFDGMTGRLSTTYECEITRELVWNRYANGKIEPVKSRN